MYFWPAVYQPALNVKRVRSKNQKQNKLFIAIFLNNKRFLELFASIALSIFISLKSIYLLSVDYFCFSCNGWNGWDGVCIGEFDLP